MISSMTRKHRSHSCQGRNPSSNQYCPVCGRMMGITHADRDLREESNPLAIIGQGDYADRIEPTDPQDTIRLLWHASLYVLAAAVFFLLCILLIH